MTKPDYSDFTSGGPRSFQRHKEIAELWREAPTAEAARDIAHEYGYQDSALLQYDEFIGPGKPISGLHDLVMMDYMHNDLLGLVKNQVQV